MGRGDKNMTRKNVDMNSPKLLGQIIRCGVPLVFISLIQNVFNSVDMVMLLLARVLDIASCYQRGYNSLFV